MDSFHSISFYRDVTLDDAADELCRSRGTLVILLSITVVGGVLNLLAFPFLESGSATHVVARLNLYGAGGLILVFAIAIWACDRRGGPPTGPGPE